jgi:predicted metalloprotease with PDZ domain
MKAQSQANYVVSVDPRRHEIDVTLNLEAEGTAILQTPTWVPGDYDFYAFGRDVFGVTAVDGAEGTPLAVRREGWQGYAVDGVAGAAEVTYTASATSTDLSEGAGTVRDDYAVLLGARYLFPPTATGPCRVTYVVPEAWPIHHPSGATQLDVGTWEYPSYEILLDTPVVMGSFDLVTRTVEGTDFHSVFLNRADGWDGGQERLADALALVAGQLYELFGSFPFADYTFVMSHDPRDEWGLEHLSSTMVGLDPAVFTDADQFAIGIRTCAHELFHAWNVRRLRPAPLGDLDFVNGSFTDGLWFAEGFTRYYEFLTCTRTGVYTPAQFLSAVVNYFRHLEPLPAFGRVTPADSSLASYLNHEKYPGRANSAIDYYDAGMLLAFWLDSRLRIVGDSLDAALRDFYDAYAMRGAGWTLDDLQAALDERVASVGSMVVDAVTMPALVGPVSGLELAGFAVAEADVPYLGVIMDGDTGPQVSSVLDTSPAGAAGLMNEDVVTAVNGVPYSLDGLTAAVAAGGEVTLDVLRGIATLRYTIPVSSRSQIATVTWAGDAERAAAIAAWLNQDFSPQPGESIPLDFYENFHGIETVI